MTSQEPPTVYSISDGHCWLEGPRARLAALHNANTSKAVITATTRSATG
jgi:hypothetical protein